MVKKMMVCLAAAMVLCGCSVDSNIYNKQDVQVSSSNIEADNGYQDIWADFVNINGESVENLLGIPPVPNLLPLYINGLSHKSALVRWYSANQAIEFAFDDNKETLVTELEKLKNDPDEKVKNAAEFAYSALTKNFDGDKFIKTKDGKRVAFYRFHEAAFNGGDIYIGTDNYAGSWYKYKADGSINRLSWAPDGERLCVEYGGRSWGFISIIDLATYQMKDVGLFSHIMKHQKDFSYKMIANPRTDPQIILLEWSPKSDKMLLFYSFSDDDYKLQSGSAIYNINKNSFEDIKPYPEEDDEGVNPRKPEGFKWE